jgi:isoquinoline 1-oxidoreductase alpha subunit
MHIRLSVNGKIHEIDADPEMPLLWALRDLLKLKGTKFGCGGGFCGACTVHLNGAPVRSCQLPLSRLAGMPVTTIEGIGSSELGTRVQKAWQDLDVPQCGYCQSGQIMAAAALLATEKHPTDDQIDAFMSGNLCRCGTYVRIRSAIHQAAGGGSK